MFKHGELLVVSILVGSIARALILRIDYRQFPSYPHSYLIHLTLGAIASTLGALFIPALLAKEYIAVTFLTIGAQQFRDVRSLERDSLNSIEKTELIPRGTAYIEGIAKLFEARNYLALLTALITSLIYYYSDLLWAVIGGVVFAYTLHYFMQGITIAEIAEVKIVPLNIKGMNIGIEQTIILNVGEKSALMKWQEEGIGIKVVPKDENARATLANLGQRQAIIHDLSILMGIKLDQGMQQFTPLARLNLDNGTLNLIIIPQEPDPVFIQKAIKQIPVLESSQRKPLKSKFGQKAAD